MRKNQERSEVCNKQPDIVITYLMEAVSSQRAYHFTLYSLLCLVLYNNNKAEGERNEILSSSYPILLIKSRKNNI